MLDNMSLLKRFIIILEKVNIFSYLTCTIHYAAQTLPSDKILRQKMIVTSFLNNKTIVAALDGFKSTVFTRINQIPFLSLR